MAAHTKTLFAVLLLLAVGLACGQSGDDSSGGGSGDVNVPPEPEPVFDAPNSISGRSYIFSSPDVEFGIAFSNNSFILLPAGTGGIYTYSANGSLGIVEMANPFGFPLYSLLLNYEAATSGSFVFGVVGGGTTSGIFNEV